jgi:hypothetical protein
LSCDYGEVENIHHSIFVYVRAGIEAGLARHLSKGSLDDGQIVATYAAVAVQVAK